jgi:uncharacterized RDD family membrane protein YckC
VDRSGPIPGLAEVVPAALGRRAAARVLDVLLIVVGPAAVAWWEAKRAEGFNALAPLFLLLSWLLVGLPVYEMVSVGWFGQSVGKAAMRVHVVTTAGSLPSWRQATARAALLALPMALLLSPLFPVTLAYLIWLVVDLTRRPQHRSWVDRLAGTVVVKDRTGPTRRHGRVRIAPTGNEPGISGTVLRRIALGALALGASGAAYYLFAATPWWPLGVAVLAGVVAGVAAAWGHGPSWRAAVVCTFGGCALVAVATVRVLSVKRDGYRSVTNGGDVHRSPGGRFLRSADGVKGGRRPSTRTGAKRRPLTPASTAGEWAPDSGRFLITSSVVACSFCASGNSLGWGAEDLMVSGISSG